MYVMVAGPPLSGSLMSVTENDSVACSYISVQRSIVTVTLHMPDAAGGKVVFQAAGGHIRELSWGHCFHHRNSAAAWCSCHVQDPQTQHAGPTALL